MARKSSTLVAMLGLIPDPRREGGNLRHKLVDILVLAFGGVLCGSQDFTEVVEFAESKEEFFRQFLELPHGIPSEDTFERVFARIDPLALQRALVEWLKSVRQEAIAERSENDPRPVAIDGKTLRRSFDQRAGLAAFQLVSAWASEEGLLLGQVAVEPGSGEIPAIAQLVDLLDLKGTVVTIDAAGCQKEIAARIIEKKGDYLLALKGNQESLYQEVKDYFLRQSDQEKPDKGVRRIVTTEQGHGRSERREVMVAPAPKTLVSQKVWSGLKSLVLVLREATHHSSGKTEGELRYFISSLEPKAGQLGSRVRSHGKIENQLHWVLDVVFAEDQSRVRRDKGPENWGMLNRVALSLAKSERDSKGSLKCKRKRAGWNEAYLLHLLCCCS